MKERLADAQAAAIHFLDILGETDSAQVLTFAREVKRLTPMTTSRSAARASISATVARGDTALYDALYESVTLLKERAGRKAIVLLSDGVDDDGTGKQLSKHTVREVLTLARQVNVPIYVVGLGTELDEATLTQVAQDTGGLYLKTPNASELKLLYASIGEQLAGQYAIHYTSNLPGDGSEHVVALQFGEVRSTKAYISPAKALPKPKTEGNGFITKPPPGAGAAIRGGDGFDTTVPLEPGKIYRLDHHQRPGEFDYFYLDVQDGQTIEGFILTGATPLKGEHFPYAGFEILGPKLERIAEVSKWGPRKRKGVELPILKGDGGRYYVLIGHPREVQHMDAVFRFDLVRRPWLGVYHDMFLNIQKIYPDSPAAEAGIQPGDVITTLNGKPVKGSNDLRRRLSVIDPNATIELGVVRHGEDLNLTVKLKAIE
jgi:hypothetical protein